MSLFLCFNVWLTSSIYILFLCFNVWLTSSMYVLFVCFNVWLTSSIYVLFLCFNVWLTSSIYVLFLCFNVWLTSSIYVYNLPACKFHMTSSSGPTCYSNINCKKSAYVTIISGLYKWHCVAVMSKLVWDCRKLKITVFGKPPVTWCSHQVSW